MTVTAPVAAATAPELLGFATCPLCHTTAAARTGVAGEDWQCGRCGQKWSGTRMARVTAYAAWVAAQLAPGR